MRTSIIAFATLALASLAGASGALAAPYRWCADYNGHPRNCGFNQYEQCMEALSGNGGTCVENPGYQAPDHQRHHD